jgi:hypothetical protein
MSVFYFVAGEQLIRSESISILDAWMLLEQRAKHCYPVAREFRELPIAGTDCDGNVLATRSWQGWHDAVLEDTYGSNWREVLDHASSLM